MDAQTKGLLLGFGLVVFSLVAASLIKQLQSGTRVFSRLSKAIEVPFDKTNRDFHEKFFLERLASLGFKRVEDGEPFVQGGTDLGGLGAGPHAKTKKTLSLDFRDSGPGKAIATIRVSYTSIVGVDEGESAYCDAVLNFVSGNSDKMATVPRESILALDSFVGGILACLLAALLKVCGELGLWAAVLSLGVTEMALGVAALVTIVRKSPEMTGRWKAVAGIVLSASAVCLSLYFIISTHS